jgi:transmembrane sensor
VSTEYSVDDRVLARYLAGEASEAEASHVHQWAAGAPEHGAMLSSLENAWSYPERDVDLPSFDAQGMAARVLREGQLSRKAQGLSRRLATRRLGSVVAAATIAFVLANVWQFNVPPVRVAAAHQAERVVRVPHGRRATLTLRDGTRVALAPGAELRVAPEFGERERVVHLIGEAYFTVRQERAPFIVRSPSMSVRVLGTAFLVRATPRGDSALVAVSKGRVVTSAFGRTETLSEGMIARLSDSTLTATQVGDLTPYTGWVDDHLVFEDARVSSMLETMSRWYGYQFQLNDSTLAKRRVSVVFELSKKDETLALLRHVLHVTMTQRGDVLTLIPVRSAPKASVRGAAQLSQPLEKGR